MAAPPARTPPALLAVFVATFFVRFGFGLTLAVFTSYLAGQSSGLTLEQTHTAGWVSALAPTGEFTTVIFSGLAADRFGRFRILFLGMAAAALLLGAVATTRDPYALGGANLAFGVASGAILASSLAVVAEFSGSEERGFEMGRFDAMNLFGWVAGFAFGLGLEELLPNRDLGVVFLAGAGALLAGLAASAVFAGEARRASAPPAFALRSVLRHAFRLPVLVVTVPWFVIYALVGTALAFLEPSAASIGVRPGYLALAIAGGGALLVVTQPYFGRLADRRGRTALMTVGAIGFGLVMLFGALLVGYGFRWYLGVGLGASVLAALAYGPAALAALADLAREISRATTMAIYSLTISFGMLVGIFSATGLVSVLGPQGLYIYFGALAVALGGLTAARWREAAHATIPVR